MATQKTISSPLATRLEHSENGIAAFVDSDAWQRLPRPLQQTYEQYANRSTFLLVRHAERAQRAEQLRAETIQTLVATANEWDEKITAVEDETERNAMIKAKQDDLVAEYRAQERTLNALDHLHEQATAYALTTPGHQWVQDTPGDRWNDFWSGGESKLARMGLPPLTAGESWLNAVLFGHIADKRIREAQRAPLMAQHPDQDAAETEDIIDVTYTPD